MRELHEPITAGGNMSVKNWGPIEKQVNVVESMPGV